MSFCMMDDSLWCAPGTCAECDRGRLPVKTKVFVVMWDQGENSWEPHSIWSTLEQAHAQTHRLSLASTATQFTVQTMVLDP